MSNFKFGDLVQHVQNLEDVIGVVVCAYAGDGYVLVKFDYCDEVDLCREEDLIKRNNQPIEKILEWFKAAIPKPTLDNQMMQLGCHFEEIKEMCDAIGLYDDVETQESRFKNQDERYLDKIVSLDKKERLNILDALCDQIVTAVGVGYMMGMDIQGALDEVIKSNNSKFENGKPVFDYAGKIVKGKKYFKPDLEKFV